ncbi:MAG: GUN4 domain-containing protein [Leptolyngbyaceae bacterium]|nr:GUN4 domain-containing protein [Leptolyngbyaceae bacterium]
MPNQPPQLPAWTQPLIRWGPLGAAGFPLIGSLINNDLTQVLWSLPVTAITAAWATYGKAFVDRVQERAGEQAKQDADATVDGLGKIVSAVRWRFSDYEQQYLNCQAYQCEDHYDEDAPRDEGILNVQLAEVFVPLQVTTVRSHGDDLLSREQRQEAELRAQLAEQEENPPQIWDFLQQIGTVSAYRRMVIQALGGYGKTTLLKHLVYVYAHQPQEVWHQYPDLPKLVPVLLYLRKWRETIAAEDAPDLPTLIQSHHLPDLPGGKEVELPSVWVKTLLKNGGILVMLDGFDEVTKELRPAVSRWINQQMRDYPKAMFVLTTRPAGYGDYTGEKFDTGIFIRPFNDEQQRDFVERWYWLQERYDRGNRDTPKGRQDAQRKADELLKQIQQSDDLEKMTDNPLNLNMIAQLHRYYGDKLPQYRAELYSRMCELQLDKRPRAKRKELVIPYPANQRVLQGMALAMQQQGNTLQLAFEDVVALAQRHVSTLSKDDLEEIGTISSSLVKIFVQQVIDVSELMVQREADDYQFAHRTFQEYLAAVEIRRTKQEQLLVDKAEDENWRDTTLLYAAQRNPSQLIQSLTAKGTDEALFLAHGCWQAYPKAELVKPEITEPLQQLRYQKLAEYLEQQDWKAADKETYRMILASVGKTSGLAVRDLQTMPCDDLLRMDRLWLNASNNHFGFSAQKAVWEECGSPMDYNRDWERFGDRVGWRKDGDWLTYDDVIFDTSAPYAHHPVLGGGVCVVWGLVVVSVSSLASRLAQCSR